MKGRALVLVTVTLFGGTPAISQQDADTVLQRPGFAGQVEVSPIPRVKIVRPADNPADNDTEDAAKSDANADADTDDPAKPQVGDGALTPPTAGNVPGAETEQEEKQPRVVRLGGDLSKSETTEAGDGTWKEERDDRLKTVPKRASLSDVEQNAPPPIVPIETPGTNLMRGARLRQLDKMTGQIQTYDMAVGEAVQVARLERFHLFMRHIQRL